MQVLIVDDNAMNRDLLRRMLGTADIDVAEADSGEAALARLYYQYFDLVLMDLRMPGIDGLTAIRDIRARTDPTAATPIVVVTADHGPQIRNQCLAAAADDVLFKPIGMQALFEAIARVMAKHGRSTVAVSGTRGLTLATAVKGESDDVPDLGRRGAEDRRLRVG